MAMPAILPVAGAATAGRLRSMRRQLASRVTLPSTTFRGWRAPLTVARAAVATPPAKPEAEAAPAPAEPAAIIGQGNWGETNGATLVVTDATVTVEGVSIDALGLVRGGGG